MRKRFISQNRQKRRFSRTSKVRKKINYKKPLSRGGFRL